MTGKRNGGRSAKIRGAVALLFLGAASGLAGGCAEEVQTQIEASNHLTVKAVTDTFSVKIGDLENVYDVLDYDWDVTTTQAAVLHRSFIPHGASQLIIHDADGKLVYDRPLLYNIDAVTDSGAAGTWTVEVGLYGVTGRVEVLLEKAD